MVSLEVSLDPTSALEMEKAGGNIPPAFFVQSFDTDCPRRGFCMMTRNQGQEAPRMPRRRATIERSG
jgi:hypothetical protein